MCEKIESVIEINETPNRKQKDDVRSTELDFMLDLETLTKETEAVLDLFYEQCCPEDSELQQIPEDYKQVAKRLTHRWGITMVDVRIIVPRSVPYAALQFGHPGMNTKCNDATNFQ